MIRKKIRAGMALVLSLCMVIPNAYALSGDESPDLEYDGYLVKLKDEIPQQSLFLLDGGDSSWESGLIVVDSLEEALDIPKELVEYIEPNYLVELFDENEAGDEPADGVSLSDDSDVPNDPYYAEYQWNLQTINAYEAYRQNLTGSGVKVGFVDSGINIEHEDVNAKHISGANFNQDGLAYDEDTYGHGTFAAGIVAAQTNNKLGIAGIAPDVELHAYRIFSAKTTTTDAVVAAIEQAVQDGCQVINLSLGTPNSSTALRDAVEKAVDSGAVVVAAVGNDGTAVTQYPAGYPGVIGVGSVDKNLEVSSFSQRNTSVDFTAPGGGVASLSNTGKSGYKLDITASSNQGTSFAAPVITGMAALALGYDKDIKADGIFALLQASAVDKGAEGYDTSYGYGVVDVAMFVEELTREYTISYQLDGGTLPEGAVSTYNVQSDTVTLPVPEKAGYQFSGWYADEDCKGDPVMEIPAGSVGDLTLYAGWQTDLSTAVASVYVDGYAASLQEDGTFLVYFPYGADLSAVTADNIVVTPMTSTSTADYPKQSEDDSTIWHFTIRSEAPVVTKTYTIRLSNFPLHVKEGAAAQTGIAVPASLDGTRSVVSYEVQDVSAWFQYGEGGLPEDFAALAEMTGGTGTLNLEGNRLTYTPSAEDAGKTVTLTVRGSTGNVSTPDAVTVAIAVDPLPTSNAVLITETETFDPYTQETAEFMLTMYDNSVTAVKVGETDLSSVQYRTGSVSIDGSAALILTRAGLSALADGEYTVTISFDKSVPVVGKLTVARSEISCTAAYRAASLTLTDNIALNYKATVVVPEDIVIPYTVGSLFWTTKPQSYTVADDPQLKIEKDGVNSDLYRYEDNTGYHVFTYDDIPAKQMNDTIYSVVYVLIDGQYFYSDPLEYSVAKCAMAVLNSAGYSAEFKTLAVDMLNYGAAAQSYFGYRTDNLANRSLTGAQKALGTSTDVALADGKTKYGTDSEEVKFSSVSLTLESAVWLNYKVSVAQRDGAVIDSVVLLYDDEFSDVTDWETRREANELKTAAMTLDGAIYTGSIQDIVAKELRKPYYTQVRVGYRNGDTVAYAYSSVLKFAISDFACAARQQGSSGLKPLSEALMRYGDAAAAYFNSLH